MNILLVTVYYPPEIGAGAHVIYELAVSLQALGHNVTVITGFPRYNLKNILSQYHKGLLMNEVLDGIPIRRIRIPSLPRMSKILRGVEHFACGLWLSALALCVPRAEVFLVHSPPLPLSWLICWVGRLRCMLEAMERQMYHMAKGVTVHSPGNEGHVIQSGGRNENDFNIGNAWRCIYGGHSCNWGKRLYWY